MLFDYEAFREVEILFEQASVEIEHPVTFGAVEMMMMLQVRSFVSTGLTGKIHPPQRFLIDHIIQRPVHGGDAKVWNLFVRAFQHLVGAEGALNT